MIRYISTFIPVSKIILMGFICFNCAINKSTEIAKEIIPEFISEPSTEVVESIPVWYINIPLRDGFRYQVGTAISKDKHAVSDQAENYAYNNLAVELESEINDELNHALDQIGKSENSFLGKALKRSGEKIISRHIGNYAVVEKEIHEEYSDIGYIYRAYILIEWDEGPAQQELLAKIKHRASLYSKMESTDLLEKIEAAVQAYNNQ